MSRHNYKWTINELLSLHREYELLALPVQVIAAKHKRTTQAIIHKLIEEELFYMNDDDDYSSDSTSSSDAGSVNDELYEDDEDDADDESIAEKKELPQEDDKNVEYIYIHQYAWNVFCNYFFPDKISYRYRLI
jgi:hypothetical protein